MGREGEEGGREGGREEWETNVKTEPLPGGDKNTNRLDVDTPRPPTGLKRPQHLILLTFLLFGHLFRFTLGLN